MKEWLFLIWSLPAFAGEVVDLGRLEVTGQARGPRLSVVSADEPSRDLLASFARSELLRLEKKLLKKKERER